MNKKEKEEKLLRVKCQISPAGAKRILGDLKKRYTKRDCEMLEKWIDTFVRENSYPPSLVSNDFMELVEAWFDKDKVEEIKERVRNDAKRFISCM
jgi:hypothetical protein